MAVLNLTVCSLLIQKHGQTTLRLPLSRFFSVAKCMLTGCNYSLQSSLSFSLMLLSAVSRFSRLRSLNLSNNHLGQFPLAICDIATLTEVNLSCNYLASVPSSVGAMTK